MTVIRTFLFGAIEQPSVDDGRYAPAKSAFRDVFTVSMAAASGGRVEGEVFYAVFNDALAAVDAARRIQTELPPDTATVRIGIHSGISMTVDGDHAGLDVNQAARISQAAHGGQILASGVTVEMSGVQETVDLGEHRLKDLARPVHLFEVTVPGRPASFPRPRTLTGIPTNLPIQLTSFVGRTEEVGKLSELVGTARLVTLVGEGGAGKTRLALQVAAEVSHSHPGGVWFADLSAVPDPQMLESAVAAALGVREQPERTVRESIVSHLEGSGLLLILDNSEQVVDAVSELAEHLLRSCPDLRVLATSRFPLGVAGERRWQVEPLGLPDPSGDDASAMRSEAVRLFVERAEGGVEPRDLTRVAELCRRLHGLPLAIELAAARARTQGIEEAFRLLDITLSEHEASDQGLPHRQRTLAGTLRWTYDLLDAPARTLLNRLTVFAGGFTFEAAEEVCSDDEVNVVDALSTLLDGSLVVEQPVGGERRFRLLDTTRDFAHACLVASGEEEQILDRHLRWSEVLAVDANRELTGPNAAEWMQRCEREQDNVRVAMTRALDAGDTFTATGLAYGHWRYWVARGRLAEPRAWVDRLLQLPPDPELDSRLVSLTVGFHLARASGDVRAAADLAERAVAEARSGGVNHLASALSNLAASLRSLDRLDEAATAHEEVLEIRRGQGDPIPVARTLSNLGLVLSEMDRGDEARAHYEEALDLVCEAGDLTGQAQVQLNLANLFRLSGEFERALEQLADAERVFEELRNVRGICSVLLEKATVLHRAGRLDEASSIAHEAYELARSQQHALNASQAILRLAFVALSQRDLQRAGRHCAELIELYMQTDQRSQMPRVLVLAGAAAADDDLIVALHEAGEPERSASGRSPAPDDVDLQGLVTEAEAALGAEEAERARERGRSMTLEEAADLALGALRQER